MDKVIHNIAVIGDGAWGTTLAIYLVNKGYRVKLWGAFPQYIQQVIRARENIKFLRGIKIPHQIKLTNDIAYALKDSDLIVLAIPSQFATNIFRQMKPFDLEEKFFLSVIKGIENKTHLRMSQIIIQEFGHVNLGVLSGPTIAMEVANGIPSTAVIASKKLSIAKKLQSVFNSNQFRIYTNSDVVGVELGGSIKNIIAIACGICDGLGFGTNTKAAILSRGLAEMARLGKALGSKTRTFSGLSGLGDLVTTCFNLQSRNRYVGQELGKGRHIKQIISSMNAVAEGVETVKAVFRLSQKHSVSMPITNEVYKLIYKRKNPLKAVTDLMTRKMKSE